MNAQRIPLVLLLLILLVAGGILGIAWWIVVGQSPGAPGTEAMTAAPTTAVGGNPEQLGSQSGDGESQAPVGNPADGQEPAREPLHSDNDSDTNRGTAADQPGTDRSTLEGSADSPDSSPGEEEVNPAPPERSSETHWRTYRASLTVNGTSIVQLVPLPDTGEETDFAFDATTTVRIARMMLELEAGEPPVEVFTVVVEVRDEEGNPVSSPRMTILPDQMAVMTIGEEGQNDSFALGLTIRED
jgi:hypothetical protein